jgi:hypothetical protein
VSCLPFADCRCSARDCRRPPTSSARFVVDRSACTRSGTAPRRRQPNISGGRPRISGDRAGNQDRQFIGALLDRFRHFGDLFLHLVAWHGRKIKPKPGHAIVRANNDARHRRLVIDIVSGRLWLPASCWRGAAPCTISNSLSPSQKECHRDVTGDTEMRQGECSSNEIEDLVTRIHTVAQGNCSAAQGNWPRPADIRPPPNCPRRSRFRRMPRTTLRRRRSRVAPSGVRGDWAPASGRWHRRRPQAKRP